jgi:hypothetical protein
MSGIKITKALYGAGSQTVDVTSAVTSNLKDGQINLVVTPDSLNVADPAPGSAKQLTVVYTINNGKTNTETIQDNGVLNISAPAATKAAGLTIVKAEYGYDGNFTDVTSAVQTMVRNGGINLRVGHRAVGLPDPNPNKKKKLTVEYTLNGATNSDEFDDGSIFKLSAPATTQTDTTPPSDYVGQLIGILFSSVFRFASMFLYTISIFTTADYFDAIPVFTAGPTGVESMADEAWKSVTTAEGGKRLLFLSIGALLPGFAYWGLPIYVFVRRLISTTYTL